MDAAQISYIIKQVDVLKKKGIKKRDAFKIIAEKLNTTPAAVLGKYYIYRKVNLLVEVKRKNTKETKQQRIKNSKFVEDTVISFVNDGKKVQDALLHCSNVLNKSYASVRAMWESNRNDENKTRIVNREFWNDEKDAILVKIFLEETKHNKTLKEVSEIAGKALNIESKSCLARWTNKLMDIYGKDVEFYFRWTKQKDKILLKTIRQVIEQGGTLTESFVEAAKKLQTTKYVCNTRYAKIILPEKDKLNIKSGWWTQKEVKQLFSIMKRETELGKSDFDAAKIASEVIGRNHKSCLSKYNGKLKTNVRKTPRWTDEETQILMNCIESSKTVNAGLELASEQLENKDWLSCRNRYTLIRRKKNGNISKGA